MPLPPVILPSLLTVLRVMWAPTPPTPPAMVS
jgi:hypothetical protein